MSEAFITFNLVAAIVAGGTSFLAILAAIAIDIIETLEA